MFIPAQSSNVRSSDHSVAPHPAFVWPDDLTWRREAERNATKRRALAALRPLKDARTTGLYALVRRLLGFASA